MVTPTFDAVKLLNEVLRDFTSLMKSADQRVVATCKEKNLFNLVFVREISFRSIYFSPKNHPLTDIHVARRRSERILH